MYRAIPSGMFPKTGLIVQLGSRTNAGLGLEDHMKSYLLSVRSFSVSLLAVQSCLMCLLIIFVNATKS